MAFADEIIKQQVGLALEYYHGGAYGDAGALDYSARVKDCGAIRRDYNSVAVGGCDVSLASNDTLRASARARAWWYQPGNLYLTANAQRQRISTGTATVPQIEDLEIGVPLNDPFDALNRVKPGADYADEAPLTVAGNPLDIIWTLLTTHAGWDATASSANADINYTAWAAARAACATLNLDLTCAMTGQDSLRDLIETVAAYAGLAVFPDLDYRLTFARPVPGSDTTTVHDLTVSDIAGIKPAIDDADLINSVIVYYGHDPATDAWSGSVAHQMADSVSAVGRADEKIDATTVWHNTATSAEVHAEMVVMSQAWPVEKVSLTLPLKHMLIKPGDRVRITYAPLGMSAWEARVLSTAITPRAGTIELSVRDIAAEPDRYWNYVYSADGLPPAADGWARGGGQDGDWTRTAIYYPWNYFDQGELSTGRLDCQGRQSVSVAMTGNAGGFAAFKWYIKIHEYDAAGALIRTDTLLDTPAFINMLDTRQAFSQALHANTCAIEMVSHIYAVLATNAALSKLWDIAVTFDRPYAAISAAGWLQLCSGTWYAAAGVLNAAANTVEIRVANSSGLAVCPFVLRIADGALAAEAEIVADLAAGAQRVLRIVMEATGATLYTDSGSGFDAGTALTTTATTDNYVLFGFEDAPGKASIEIDYLRWASGMAIPPSTTESTGTYTPATEVVNGPGVVTGLALYEQSVTDAAGTVSARIMVDWTEPDSAYALTYQVWHKVSSGYWANVLTAAGPGVTIPALNGLNFVRVVSVSALGSSSFDASPAATITVTAATEAPVAAPGCAPDTLQLLCHFDGSLASSAGAAPLSGYSASLVSAGYFAGGVQLGAAGQLAYAARVGFAGMLTVKYKPDTAVAAMPADRTIWQTAHPALRLYIDVSEGLLVFERAGVAQCALDVSAWTANTWHGLAWMWITDLGYYAVAADGALARTGGI